MREELINSSSPSTNHLDDAMVVDDELKNIVDMIGKPMKRGDVWYLLDKKWYDMFKLYADDKELVHNPGPVDNSMLFKSDGELKDRLQDDQDYVLVPDEAWNALVGHFSVIADSHAIKRDVIAQGHLKTYLVVEIYPIDLKLSLYGTKESIINKSFSRVTTLSQLEHEMRTLFDIDSGEETQLWSSGSLLNPHSDNNTASMSSSTIYKSSDNHSLSEAGLHSGSIVTLEVRNADGTWPSSRPKFGSITTRSSKTTPGLCGLTNLGNTCFMNSALQCMSNTGPLTEYFISDKYLSELNTENPLGMKGEIARSFAELIKAMWSGGSTCLAPREFKLAVGRFAPQFSGFSQQDCQELMAFLLDGLHEDLNRVKLKPYIEINNEVEKRPDEIVATESWSNYKKRNDSIIVDTFHGLLKSTLVCPECELVSVTFDPFCYLSLPLPVKREKPIDVIFIPAVKRLDGVNESLNVKTIHLTRLMVPKCGIINDITNAVAKALNENKEVNYNIDPEKLIVANVYNHRFNKIYNKDESYNAQIDDIVVYETYGDSLTVPLYLREMKGDDSQLFGKPLIVNISDMKYESIYETVMNQLRRYTRDPSDDESDTDEGVAECETGDLFTLTLVNSYGSLEMEKLDRTKPIKLTSKSFLAADFTTVMKDKYFSDFESDSSVLTITIQKNVNSSGKPSIHLGECISQFITTERLGADDPWYCPRCKKHQQATKKFDLWSLPQVLIIHLKRFSYSRFWRDKLDTVVDFPLNGLNMGEYVLNNPNNEPILYDVIAVANHYGGLGGGHYTAYGKNQYTQSWHYFDDSNVSVTTEDAIVSKAAYVLFYLKRE